MENLNINRRGFVKTSSLFAIGVGVFGSIHWDGEKFVGDTITTTDQLGPFYRPNAPIRADMRPAGLKGDVVTLQGRIASADGKALPTNCEIEVWHCDAAGEYDNTTEEFQFRSRQKVDSKGNYKFITMMPVPYGTTDVKRPAHFHIRVSADGQQDLITQIYFLGDPHIAKDDSAGAPESASRILNVKSGKDGAKEITFNMVLAKEFSPSPEYFAKISGLYKMSDSSMLEFSQQGEMLRCRVNGQIMEDLRYLGGNDFSGGVGKTGIALKFEPKAKGMTATVVLASEPEKPLTGSKLLRY